MSANFRRFNARIGVVFVFQAKLNRLLSWKRTSHTASLLAVYTFICLDPYLLTVLPLVLVLLTLLIPSFIARHPDAPTTVTLPKAISTYPPTSSIHAPAPTVKPVREASKDFFRNMRDLQNSMEDFTQVHDKLVTILAPPTNFSDEALSSALFLLITLAAGFMFLASHLLPWRFIFLAIGWAVIGMGHPAVQRQLANAQTSHIDSHSGQIQSLFSSWVDHDTMLDSAPEIREVEIFELQHLPSDSVEWEPWVFSPSIYDPSCAERIRDERPKGSRFFEDVVAPRGWEWSEKKWTLDLWSREWVEERVITGVEVETEGERWVYDINYENDGKEDKFESLSTSPKKGKAIEKIKPTPSWQESSDVELDESKRRGTWRRRRWVRLVKRKSHSSTVTPATNDP